MNLTNFQFTAYRCQLRLIFYSDNSFFAALQFNQPDLSNTGNNYYCPLVKKIIPFFLQHNSIYNCYKYKNQPITNNQISSIMNKNPQDIG